MIKKFVVGGVGGVVKNGCCQSGHRALKLTVSQESIDGMNWWTDFLHAGANSGKLKVDSVIFG